MLLIVERPARPPRVASYVLFFECYVSVGTNLALKKPTWQVSSFGVSFQSPNGVDGDFTSFQNTGGSTTGLPEWWGVDLETTFIVHNVLLYNRPLAGKFKQSFLKPHALLNSLISLSYC